MKYKFLVLIQSCLSIQLIGKFFGGFREGDNFGWTNESEIERVEKQYHIFTAVVSEIIKLVNVCTKVVFIPALLLRPYFNYVIGSESLALSPGWRYFHW